MKSILLTLLCGLFLAATSSAANAEPKEAGKPLIHSGLVHSREELEFINQKVAAERNH